MRVVTLRLSRRSLRKKYVRQMIDSLLAAGITLRVTPIMFALVVGAAACGSPVAPSQEAPPPLLHHNVPATMEDGSAVYLCATQPRQYVTPGGQVYLERDHYVQRGECPLTPID